MKITIIGHGYVGLVAACCFADFGNTVYVIGRTDEKLARLASGDPIIYEPGLKEMLAKNNAAGRLIFTKEYKKALEESEIVFSAVGTPPLPGTGEADLSTVYEVAHLIGQNLKLDKYTVVSCKSTVPVGTNYKVQDIIIDELKKRGVRDNFDSVFNVASCPEFLREGTGIHDTINPDRTVIGVDSDRARDTLLELHKPLPGVRVVVNIASAELIKYASNSLLATKISFANLISFYAEKTGADAEQVLRAVGLDNRIGPKFLNVGIGYGGACFPKDVQALTATGRNYGLDVGLLDAVEDINKQAWENFVSKVEKHVTTPSKIAVWGLSFKPDTDDVRFAPQVKIVKKLLELGHSVQAYDPAAMEHVKKQVEGDVKFVSSPGEALAGADMLCILTEWNEFKQYDLQEIKDALKTDLIIDGRNLYDPQTMQKLGFRYVSTGR